MSNIPLSHSVSDAIFFIILYALILFLVIHSFTIQKRLDRYRLKYSFDREIEGKDIEGNDKELRLNRRERRFKRRVFKD